MIGRLQFQRHSIQIGRASQGSFKLIKGGRKRAPGLWRRNGGLPSSTIHGKKIGNKKAKREGA
jgi:hypothetical protein